MTSFTCTSRQARTQRLQWMQASRLTAIATWLGSLSVFARAGKRLSVTPIASAHAQNFDAGSGAASRAG